MFESSVNSYGGKTFVPNLHLQLVFESSVNSYSGKILLAYFATFCGFRNMEASTDKGDINQRVKPNHRIFACGKEVSENQSQKNTIDFLVVFAYTHFSNTCIADISDICC